MQQTGIIRAVRPRTLQAPFWHGRDPNCFFTFVVGPKRKLSANAGGTTSTLNRLVAGSNPAAANMAA